MTDLNHFADADKKRGGIMTTTELIEKYGIGHNCLSDAYALGMADGLDVLEHAIEFAEEKARVDAIDEFAKLIHKDLYQLNHHQVDFLAEQLKEGAENG